MDTIYDWQWTIATGLAGTVTGLALYLIFVTVQLWARDWRHARIVAFREKLSERLIKPGRQFTRVDSGTLQTTQCRVEGITWIYNRGVVVPLAHCSTIHGEDLPPIQATRIVQEAYGEGKHWVYRK